MAVDCLLDAVCLMPSALQGPLAVMDELEFRHWMRCMAMRCALVSQHAVDQGLTGLEKSKQPLQSTIKARLAGGS